MADVYLADTLVFFVWGQISWQRCNWSAWNFAQWRS